MEPAGAVRVPAATVIQQYVRYGYWAFTTNNTFSGVDTSVTVNGAAVFDITAISADLIVDGMSIRYIRAGGAVKMAPVLQTYPGFHMLEDWTTVDADDSMHWAPLGIPLSVQSTVAFLQVMVTTAALDVMRISLWGRFMPKPDDKLPPQTVTVDGFKWPPTRRLG